MKFSICNSKAACIWTPLTLPKCEPFGGIRITGCDGLIITPLSPVSSHVDTHCFFYTVLDIVFACVVSLYSWDNVASCHSFSLMQGSFFLGGKIDHIPPVLPMKRLRVWIVRHLLSPRPCLRAWYWVWWWWWVSYHIISNTFVWFEDRDVLTELS